MNARETKKSQPRPYTVMLGWLLLFLFSILLSFHFLFPFQFNKLIHCDCDFIFHSTIIPFVSVPLHCLYYDFVFPLFSSLVLETTATEQKQMCWDRWDKMLKQPRLKKEIKCGQETWKTKCVAAINVEYACMWTRDNKYFSMSLYGCPWHVCFEYACASVAARLYSKRHQPTKNAKFQWRSKWNHTVCEKTALLLTKAKWNLSRFSFVSFAGASCIFIKQQRKRTFFVYYY